MIGKKILVKVFDNNVVGTVENPSFVVEMEFIVMDVVTVARTLGNSLTYAGTAYLCRFNGKNQIQEVRLIYPDEIIGIKL